MTFDSHLCCLWYEFAKKLGKVRIGYCAQCEEELLAYGAPGRRAALLQREMQDEGEKRAGGRVARRGSRAVLRGRVRRRRVRAACFRKTIPFVRKSASSRICGDGRSFSTRLDAAVVFEGSRQGFF